MQVQDDKPYDDINITPMLDLAYVLLVIFILMTTASIQGLKASIPRASNKPSTSKDPPKTKTITVTSEGGFKLDNALVTFDQLESGIKNAKAAVPDVPVIVKGGTGAQYFNIVQVLDMLSRVGVTKVGVATQVAK